MVLIKGDRVYTTELTSMSIESYINFQLGNLKMYNELQAKSKTKSDIIFYGERMQNIEDELVSQFNYTYEQLEEIQTSYFANALS